MAIKLIQRFCVNHPERMGHALCMSCKKTVCQECATYWDGVNYCVRCLQAKRQEAKTGSTGVALWALAAASVLLFFAMVKLVVWTWVNIVRVF